MHPVAALLANFLDVRSVWSIGHEPEAAAPACAEATFLVFADAATLERLQKSPEPGIKVLVVTDGDLFESVGRPGHVCGSLARSAWRQTSAREAFYDEAQWASGGDAGAVTRVRRKALLLWQR
jgi:hypothetical protein